LQKLDEVARTDPGLQKDRIAIIERLLRRLPPGEYKGFQAAVLNDLGVAYTKFPAGDRAANLGRAIGCHTEALRFRTAEAAPLDYARTQHNLGIAYDELPTGDRPANLQRAIGCYTEALRFSTAEAAPADHSQTALNLAFVHFSESRWEHAHDSYASAIAAGDLPYQASATEAGRQAELGEARQAVADDAYCLAHLAGQVHRGSGTAGRRTDPGTGRGLDPGPGVPSRGKG